MTESKPTPVMVMSTLFEERCGWLADRVRLKNLTLLDAVDMAQSAADISGLTDFIGHDPVQEIMARSFMGARCPA